MTLYAGAATQDISPRAPTALYGYPHVPRVSTGIHDPLLASVLVLECDKTRLVFAALDLLFLDPPTARDLRRRLSQIAGVPESHVFASCTHTHSGPVTTRLLGWQNDPAVPSPDAAYLQFVIDRTAEATVAAIANRVTAKIAWTSADARGVGGNRLKPDGVTDPECGILLARSSDDGHPLAAMLVYGMHPTVLHEDSTLVSSDFPHYARLALQEHLGTSIPILYHTAPAGNQSPRYYVQGQTFAEAERLGRKLGNAITAAIDRLGERDWLTTASLAGLIEEVKLPRRQMPSTIQAENRLQAARQDYERLKATGAPRAEIRTAECAIFGAEGAVALARSQAQGDIETLLRRYEPTEIQVIRVGPVCLLGLPGECFTDYALEIKRRAPCRTFVVSLVNGELQGYIVTPEAEAAGGYEASNSMYTADSGRIFVTTSLRLLTQVCSVGHE